MTTVTEHRKKIFREPMTCYLLLSNLAYHRFMMDFRLIGYVIMPDHLHLLLQPSEKNPLSKIMKGIKGNFSRKYNEWKNNSRPTSGRGELIPPYKKEMKAKKVQGNIVRFSPVWQEGYYETGMRTERDILNRLNYMHNNPVRKGLVEKAEDYELSSARQYLKNYRKTFQIPIDPIY